MNEGQNLKSRHVPRISRSASRQTKLRSFFLFVLLWAAVSCLSSAQAQNANPCSHVRLTNSVVVHGYIFKNYEGIDQDEDSACVQVIHNGKIVYKVNADNLEYYLGQPGDKRDKTPAIPNGADLTGTGHADMIVTSWSGGAHCCYAHFVFELEPKLRLLTIIQDGDADGAHFEKSKLDQSYVYKTNDIWSYWPSSFASSVNHEVVLQWDGKNFRLDLAQMQRPAPTSQQWSNALRDVDDALSKGGDVRGALAVSLWDTVLDLIYTGHPALAWKFVREVNPKALEGGNPSLEEFCIALKSGRYWDDLKPTLREIPEGCAKAKPSGQ